MVDEIVVGCEDAVGEAYKGHFACSCYHPLFVFNQFGGLRQAAGLHRHDAIFVLNQSRSQGRPLGLLDPGVRGAAVRQRRVRGCDLRRDHDHARAAEGAVRRSARTAKSSGYFKRPSAARSTSDGLFRSSKARAGIHHHRSHNAENPTVLGRSQIFFPCVCN
jgi:hypothetical protein